MTDRRSVTRRLKRDLALVGLIGTVLLLAAVVFFYWRTFTHMSARDAVIRSIGEMLEHAALPVIVLMAPVAFVGLRVIRQAFVPLEQAAMQIEAAHGHERGFRIDPSAMPAEALPFTHAVNELLGRLDDAAMRQEAFAADVAHELRTPLAVLALELDQLGGVDALRLKADVAAMQRLIDQLLLLAQIDAATAAQLAVEYVSLRDVASDVVSFMAPAIIASGKNITVDADTQSPFVRGRREAIAAALRNLIENAARVTPAGGTVRVRVGPGCVIGVCDEGPGLSREYLQDLVQRHRRADHASKDGAGLGLAIVDRIMAAHEGVLETAPEARELSLRFPG
ncbi:MAG: sensor histidine kinase [Novosphingobium sp.]|jgi:signal transduction histidine kinase|nr:sensor histidine kinase [Novosphingobium sp.]